MKNFKFPFFTFHVINFTAFELNLCSYNTGIINLYF